MKQRQLMLRRHISYWPTGRSTTAPRRLREEVGATLFEFAMILVILLTIFFGIAGFGHALFTYHFCSHAAREATRYAAVNGSTCNGDFSCTAPVTCTSGSCTTCTSYGSCSPATATDIANYVTGITPQGIDVANLQTTVAHCGDTGMSACTTACSTQVNAPGCPVNVKVSYNYTFLFPFVRNNPLSISSTSEMVIAH